MSHFTALELQIKDPKALEDGLRALGFNVESHDKAQALNTAWASITSGSAEIIVRCANNSAIGRADIGFKKGDDGNWSMVADDYELRKGRKWNESSLLSAVKVEYGVAVATKAAIASGMTVSRQLSNDGKVQLRMVPQKLAVRR